MGGGLSLAAAGRADQRLGCDIACAPPPLAPPLQGGERWAGLRSLACGGSIGSLAGAAASPPLAPPLQGGERWAGLSLVLRRFERMSERRVEFGARVISRDFRGEGTDARFDSGTDRPDHSRAGPAHAAGVSSGLSRHPQTAATGVAVPGPPGALARPVRSAPIPPSPAIVTGRTKATTWMRESRGVFWRVAGGGTRLRMRVARRFGGRDRVDCCIRCKRNKNSSFVVAEMSKSRKLVHIIYRSNSIADTGVGARTQPSSWNRE